MATRKPKKSEFARAADHLSAAAQEVGAAVSHKIGAVGVFVGSGIFKSDDPASMARAIVEASTHYRDASVIARVSTGLGSAMAGLEMATLAAGGAGGTFAQRGW